MIIKNGIITRRDLLRKVAYGTLAMGFSPPIDAKKKMDKVRVILIREENVIDKNGIINSDILQEMLDKGICRLLDEKDPLHAWKRLVKPSDIVGIRSNVWPYLPTPGELENAVFKRVMNACVPSNNVAIDDRGVLDNPVFKTSTYSVF